MVVIMLTILLMQIVELEQRRILGIAILKVLMESVELSLLKPIEVKKDYIEEK